jgi:hypothetical protein
MTGIVGIFCIMMLPLVAGGLTFVLSGMSVEESRKNKEGE